MRFGDLIAAAAISVGSSPIRLSTASPCGPGNRRNETTPPARQTVLSDQVRHEIGRGLHQMRRRISGRPRTDELSWPASRETRDQCAGQSDRWRPVKPAAADSAGHLAVRLSHSPVIKSKHCDALSCQEIRKYQKRLVPHELLIPVLWSASRNQDNCREMTFLLG